MRTRPVRLATPGEFDLDAAVSAAPGSSMEGREGATSDFLVPLSREAVAVVQLALRHGGAVLLPGARGGPLSEMILAMSMRRRSLEAKPHGFRSSLKSWSEEAAQPWEVVEMSLGHAVGNRAERAYRRTDLLDRRRALLDAWAEVVTGASKARATTPSRVMS
jgi:integrase